MYFRASVALVAAAALATGTPALVAAQTSGLGNTIGKEDFNFAQQLGYLYSRLDDAYFAPQGTFSFETGTQVYYTRKMARVQNPAWQRRTFVVIPGGMEVSPSDNIMLILNSDLAAEWPRQDRHSAGGNSPRFRTKIRLLRESKRRPALALTVGVKFSSAKPTNIWENRHNYQDSNGLAGLGTGVADYLIQFNVTKALNDTVWLHAQLGLAPVGDPTRTRAGSQADELPFGFGLEWAPAPLWRLRTETSGMIGTLKTTDLDHYAVARTQVERRWDKVALVLNAERGLTWTSDDWVAGTYVRTWFNAVDLRARRSTSATTLP